jgi:hypothetical protein
MWNVKTQVPPVTIGATGTVSKSLRKYLSSVPGKARYQGGEENSCTGHSTHTAGSANVRSTTEFNIADSAIRTINSTRGIAAALCALETWFVSGI